ncbi:MAG: hypothetical protein ABI347_00245 [Nitrososphaera sp.]|jgi:hypothetical protein
MLDRCKFNSIGGADFVSFTIERQSPYFASREAVISVKVDELRANMRPVEYTPLPRNNVNESFTSQKTMIYASETEVRLKAGTPLPRSH